MKKFFKKVFKGIKKVVKPIGKALKKGLGKIGKALGPVGTLALSLMLPGIGAAWASFAGAGGLAATTGGVLGGVMKGIAAAGNAVGTVYSSVSSMVGSVVKAIPGVGDAYTKLSTFTTKMMDKGRMAMGLPTSSATTAANTAAMNNESIAKDNLQIVDTEKATQMPSMLEQDVTTSDINTTFESKGTTKLDLSLDDVTDFRTPAQIQQDEVKKQMVDGAFKLEGTNVPQTELGKKMSSMSNEDFKTLGIDRNDLSRDLTEIEKIKINDFVPSPAQTPTVADIPKSTIDVNQYTSRPTFSIDKKPTMTIQSPEDFINSQNTTEFVDIFQDMKVVEEPVGQSFVNRMEGTPVKVRRDSLTDDQFKFYQERNSEFTHFNKQADRVIADATITTTDKDGKIISSTIDPDYTDLNKNMVGLKRGTAIAAAGEGLLNTATEPELEGSAGSVLPMLETDINGATDYSQAYASAFQGAGYVGPNDFNSYANAGYYGGDPFSIAQYNRRVPTPQANIRIGG